MPGLDEEFQSRSRLHREAGWPEPPDYEVFDIINGGPDGHVGPMPLKDALDTAIRRINGNLRHQSGAVICERTPSGYAAQIVIVVQHGRREEDRNEIFYQVHAAGRRTPL